ncbi:MAG: hypothetical protein V1859_04780 [archaeon]
MKCINCNGSVVLRGKRYNKTSVKQLYKCKLCKKTFVEPTGFERMRYPPEIISRAIHQHGDGFSLSKVKNHLFQHDKTKVSRWTIAKWCKKYSLFFERNKLEIRSKN